tara:strand:+ start:550 stop:840 length:291 start_codon:yes stop_codon:yes gene_type:complete
MSQKNEIKGLKQVTERLTAGIAVTESLLSHHETKFVANALLNITVSRMVQSEGRDLTTEILNRLVYYMRNGISPADTSGPVPLTSLHSGNRRLERK